MITSCKHKIITNSTYKINWSGKYVIYPYNKSGKVIAENVFKSKAPNLYNYLKQNEELLKGREYFDNSNWRGTLDLDGGTLLNQGIHYIDIMQWIVGMPDSVYAVKKTVSHDIEIEDMVLGVLNWDKGVVGTIEFTINTYPHNLECSLTVLGEKGSVKLAGSAMNKIEIWEVKDYPKPPIAEGLPPNVYAGGLYQGSCPNHEYVYRDIVKSFHDGEQNYINGREARKSLRIVNSIYQSSDENRLLKIQK